MTLPATMFHMGLLDFPTSKTPNNKHVNDYRVNEFVQNSYNKTKYTFDVPRIADQYELHGLMITFAEEAKDKYDNNLKKATLTLSVLSQVVSHNLLGFLAKTQLVTRYGEANCILFSENTRYPLDICSLPSNDFSYEIDVDCPGIVGISAIGNYRFLSHERRKQLVNEPHNQHIPINDSQVLESASVSDVLQARLEFNGVTRGYYIQGDIDNLENITLTFNGHERWNYNKIMLNVLGIHICKNLLYLSFDGVDPYNKLSGPSDSGLNCSGIDNQTIKLTFSERQKSAIVFNNGYATLEYKKNICNVLPGQ
jgi:hypothetical protein